MCKASCIIDIGLYGFKSSCLHFYSIATASSDVQRQLTDKSNQNEHISKMFMGDNKFISLPSYNILFMCASLVLII